MGCQYLPCDHKSRPGSERAWHGVSPTPRGRRRGFLRGKWPDPRGGSPAALPGKGSHLAVPHRAPTGHRLTARKPAAPPTPPPTPLWMEGGQGTRGGARAPGRRPGPRGDGGGGELPPPRQEGPPQLPFWGPTPHFPISPLNWGGGHCFPQARDLWPLELVGDSGHGRPWAADARDPPVAGSA